MPILHKRILHKNTLQILTFTFCFNLYSLNANGSLLVNSTSFNTRPREPRRTVDELYIYTFDHWSRNYDSMICPCSTVSLSEHIFDGHRSIIFPAPQCNMHNNNYSCNRAHNDNAHSINRIHWQKAGNTQTYIYAHKSPQGRSDSNESYRLYIDRTMQATSSSSPSIR